VSGDHFAFPPFVGYYDAKPASRANVACPKLLATGEVPFGSGIGLLNTFLDHLKANLLMFLKNMGKALLIKNNGATSKVNCCEMDFWFLSCHAMSLFRPSTA
jgi:hypothetical protein